MTMKKAIALMLSLLLLASLAACGDNAASEEQMITRPAEKDAETVALQETSAASTEAAEKSTEKIAAVGHYTFSSDGVELIPGDPFDPSLLPKANSVYQVPSCAIEGTDNLYHYGTFELTAFDDGTSEVIYSILLIDPNITTPEGLALGDSADKVLELYGEDYTQQGSAYVYTGEMEALYIIIQGAHVASIEYRMIVG